MFGSDIDPSGLGQTAAETPAIAAIIYCQELNALPPGTSLISPVDGVDLPTSSCKKWGYPAPGSDAYEYGTACAIATRTQPLDHHIRAATLTIAMSESPEICEFSSTEAISQHCYNVSTSN